MDWHESCLDLIMKLAVTVWNNRVAPVFDSAGTALLLDIHDDVVVDESTISLKTSNIDQRAAFLQSVGVNELICGAASSEAQRALRERNIGVHAFVAGEVPDVVSAWLSDGLNADAFSLPGCACINRGRGLRRGRCRGSPNRAPFRWDGA